MDKNKHGFSTQSIHAGYEPDPTTGARVAPIYQTTSYVFPDTDTASSIFNLDRGGHGQPTSGLRL